MKRLGKMIGSQKTYTKMSIILKDILNNMNNYYDDTDRLLEDAGFHQDQDFLKAEHEKHEQVMKHYDNIIKELKEFINTVDTDIDKFDKTMNTIEQEYQNKMTVAEQFNKIVEPAITFVEVKLHNSNKDTQIIAKLPSLDKIPKAEKNEITVALVANIETFTFLNNAHEDNDAISIYHEVLTDKEFKNMIITKWKYDNDLLIVWLKYLK